MCGLAAQPEAAAAYKVSATNNVRVFIKLDFESGSPLAVNSIKSPRLPKCRSTNLEAAPPCPKCRGMGREGENRSDE
jgi:hypothetical protein